MGTRISRAKQTLRKAGARFELQDRDDVTARTVAVMSVLYLIFNEGYTATAGDELSRNGLTTEAIRLTRMLRTFLPHDPEATGLLALMLLTEARRPTRTDPHHELVPIPDQDRTRWNTDLITEGQELIEQARAPDHVGPYERQPRLPAGAFLLTVTSEGDWTLTH